jgi:hypothetical protein
MGFFDKLFGKKPAPTPAVDPRLAEILKEPPRLINEGPEFPHEPIVLRRTVTQPQLDAALAAAGFARAGERAWMRGETSIEQRDVHNVNAIAFSGSGSIEAQRELLATLPWVNPLRDLYAGLGDPKTSVADLQYLIGAAANYRCAGGIPRALRSHPSPEVQEAIRLVDREQQMAAAREQRARKKGR